MSAKKALRGSETETGELLGGTEENSVSSMRGVIDLLSRQINDLSKKEETEKIELVSRPANCAVQYPCATAGGCWVGLDLDDPVLVFDEFRFDLNRLLFLLFLGLPEVRSGH